MTTAKRLTYSEWLRQLDAACWRIAGCSYQDLDDYCYADRYNDGYSPVSTARAMIRYSKGLDE